MNEAARATSAASAPPPLVGGSRSPAVKFIFLTLLLDVMGFGLLIPVAPRLVQELLGWKTELAGLGTLALGSPTPMGPVLVAGAQHLADAQAAPIVGWLMATYALCQFVFAPILGSLSDHVGRRPVILIALLGSAVDYFAGALAPTLAILFITRAINGISGANFSVCNAYVADVTPPKKRAAAFGMIGAAFGLGFILGPIIGGVLGNFDVRLPYWGAGLLTLANVAYGALVLPESLPLDRRRAFSLKKANPVGVFAHLARYPLVMGLGAAFFFLNLAQYGLHSTWVLYTEHRYGWGPVATGLSLTIVGIGAAIVQGGLAGRAVKLLGERGALLIGIALGIAAYVAYGLATQGWMIYALVAVASLGGIAGPAVQSIISKSVLPTEQGEVQGAMSAISNLSLIIGPPAASNVFAYFISGDAPVYLPGASFFLSAALAFIGLLIAAAILRRHHVPEGQTVRAPGEASGGGREA